MRTTILALTLIAAAPCAVAQQRDTCPMRIEVSNSGEFFTNRFHGHYKTSPKLLESDLRAGCYNDANASKVTSVSVRIAPQAPRRSIENLYQILARNGWPKSKVHIEE